MCQFTDRFYSAVRTLAGDGPVKQRLLTAYKDNLEALPADGVPDSIRHHLDALRQAMTAAKPVGQECAIVATVRKMSPAQASGLAVDIVAMFSELVRARSTGERIGIAKPREKTDAVVPAVPSHLALN
jgi:hypothetical protein